MNIKTIINLDRQDKKWGNWLYILTYDFMVKTWSANSSMVFFIYGFIKNRWFESRWYNIYFYEFLSHQSYQTECNNELHNFNALVSVPLLKKWNRLYGDMILKKILITKTPFSRRQNFILNWPRAYLLRDSFYINCSLFPSRK